MKLIKSVSFWFFIIAIAICLLNYSGQDDKNILFFFFGLDPILHKIVYSTSWRDFIIESDSNTITFFGYGLRIILATFYGAIIDLLMSLLKKSFK